jgi:hypothetical protein
MIAMLSLSTVTSTKAAKSIQDLLTDFIIGIKPHAKIGLYFQNLGKRLSIDQTTFSMENSILF